MGALEVGRVLISLETLGEENLTELGLWRVGTFAVILVIRHLPSSSTANWIPSEQGSTAGARLLSSPLLIHVGVGVSVGVGVGVVVVVVVVAVAVVVVVVGAVVGVGVVGVGVVGVVVVVVVFVGGRFRVCLFRLSILVHSRRVLFLLSFRCFSTSF